jgi:hypothetical protein
MSKTTVTIIAVLIGLVLLGLLLVVPLIILRVWNEGGWTIGQGMMDRNFGYHMPFGGVTMVGIWLIPLAIVGVLIAGAIASIIGLSRPRNPAPPAAQIPPVMNTITSAQNCPNCDKAVQSEWVACPHCGSSLKS